MGAVQFSELPRHLTRSLFDCRCAVASDNLTPHLTVTSRERVLAVLAGKPVDRPPAMPITMMWAADLIGAKYHDYANHHS